MAESDVFDEEKLFATFLQRGKAFGLQETDLMDYVDKQIRQAQERQDRLIVRREEEANRKQLELAAIKQFCFKSLKIVYILCALPVASSWIGRNGTAPLSASVSQSFGQCTNLSDSCGGSGLFFRLIIGLSLT